IVTLSVEFGGKPEGRLICAVGKFERASVLLVKVAGASPTVTVLISLAVLKRTVNVRPTPVPTLRAVSKARPVRARSVAPDAGSVAVTSKLVTCQMTTPSVCARTTGATQSKVKLNRIRNVRRCFMIEVCATDSSACGRIDGADRSWRLVTQAPCEPVERLINVEE